MNRLSIQKFMNLCHSMLSDKNGNLIAQSLNVKQQVTQSVKPSVSDDPDFLKGDDIDITTFQKQKQLETRLNERNLLFLKKVQAAKKKIEEGTYGVCEDCGNDISQKRLLARPTACLCISCQEEKEKEQYSSFKHRRDLKKSNITEENDGYISQRKFNSVAEIGFESIIDIY